MEIENNIKKITLEEEQEIEEQQTEEEEKEEERKEENKIKPNDLLTKQKSVKDRYGFILSNDSIELRRTEQEKLLLMEKELERTKKWIKMVKKWEYTITHKGPKLRERLRKGIPDSLRSDVWSKLACVNDMKQIYPNKFLLTQPTNVPEITIDEIERDINRTFPSHDFFENGQSGSNNGQNSLRRILQSYASFDPETGYCQGMGFIAAMFLIYMVEEDAFYALLSLLQRPTLPLRAMYRPGMPGTKLVLNVFSHLGERYLPKVWNHLTNENIHYSMYATSWFMTLYTNSFPFDLVTKVFDVLWYEGFKIVYRVALALLKYSEDFILSHQFEDILLYFRTLPQKVDYVKLWKIVWEIPLKSDVIEMYSNRHYEEGGANI